MTRKGTDPLHGPLGALAKFIGAALFGCFVSVVVFVIAFQALDFETLGEAKWLHALWFVPLIWGVLGIFWFEPMLDLARRVFEDFFNINE